MLGRGIRSDAAFARQAVDAIRESLDYDGQIIAFEQFIAPEASSVSFSKALNCSVTDSMNDLIQQAIIWIECGGISLHEVSRKLNGVLLSALGTGGTSRSYGTPEEAFGGLLDKYRQLER